MVGHLEELVELCANPAELGLQLVHTMAVPHVFGEVVKAAIPVIEGSGDEHYYDWHDTHSPEWDTVDVEDRPADVDCGLVAVGKDGRGHPDEQAE